MAYHGEDLDLRTPQTWASAPADGGVSGEQASANGKRGPFQSAPVLVDDAVLACFNQAYDIAVAHRAGDVRVEHLLNAMTRLDASAAALEARGIRVVALKRETAAIIAGEIPTVAGSGAVSPHRSEEVSELLKYAAALASRRNAPITVEDLLQVLFERRSEFGAAELLIRFASRMADPLPPLTRPDPRYPVGGGYRYPVDYGRPPYAQDYFGTPADAMQNSRIEALEQVVRALGQDLANERHAIANLIRDFARDTFAHQDDQGRTHALLIDRIGALETAVRDGSATSAPSSFDPSPLVAKLGDIEAGLELRLHEMSQSWAILSTRLQDLEASILDRPVIVESGSETNAIPHVIDLKPLTDRLDIIEEAVLGSDHRSSFVELGDRLSRLEDGIGQMLTAPAADGSTHAAIGGLEKIDDLSDSVTGLIGHLNGLSGSFEGLAANFDGLSGKFDGVAAIADGLSGKFDDLSGKFDGHYGSLTELILSLGDRVGAAERAIAAEIDTAAAKHEAYTQDLTEVHEALLKVNQNQLTLAGSMDQWRAESSGDVATIINRLAAVDHDTAVPAETLKAVNTNIEAMNRFIVEHYHRRHRFRSWLFGTDDWMGASWPAARATAETEQPTPKNGGKAET